MRLPFESSTKSDKSEYERRVGRIRELQGGGFREDGNIAKNFKR